MREMAKLKDITGQRFDRLIVLKYTGEKYRNGITLWLCKCDCGNEVIVSKNALKQGLQKSCGCLKKEIDRTRTSFEKKGNLKGGTKLNLISSKRLYKCNKSGVKGVYWNKQRNLWTAQLMFGGEIVFRDSFANKQDAINARKEAEEKYFKPTLEKFRESDG
jgi:hypothetical protein